MSSYLRFPAPAPGARGRLLIFPHAGAGASAYRHWPAPIQAVADVEVAIVQLPAREDRLEDPAPFDIGDVARELTGSADQYVALHGHSWGAQLAFETALELRRRGVETALLSLAACAAPHRHRPKPATMREGAGLRERLRRLGGFAEDILDDPAVMEVLLPALVADLSRADGVRDVGDGALAADLMIFAGVRDTEDSPDSCSGWQRYTTGSTSMILIDSGHFFGAYEARVIGALADRLAGLCGPSAS